MCERDVAIHVVDSEGAMLCVIVDFEIYKSGVGYEESGRSQSMLGRRKRRA